MRDFPEGIEFLKELNSGDEKCSHFTDEFYENGGTKLPATVTELSGILSLLYRISCCYWGCNNGDHQMEWLVGRITNQSLAAIRLIRAAYYDEALVLIRGIGEVANLFQLFSFKDDEFEEWSKSDLKKRLKNFSPSAVRKKLEAINVPFLIEKDRYSKLCEVGVHPVPGQAPGHFNGTGKPMLGGIPQTVGIFVCFSELAFAVSVGGIGLIKTLDVEKNIEQEIFDRCTKTLLSIGKFNILNYETLLEEMLNKNE